MENKIFELADRLKALRDQKSATEAELKEINAKIDQTDYALSELMASEELQNFTRDGNTFYLRTNLYASVAAGEKRGLFIRLRDKGYGELVTENVHPNTLSSFVKEQKSENNDELPDWLIGLVNVHEKTSVGVRKAK